MTINSSNSCNRTKHRGLGENSCLWRSSGQLHKDSVADTLGGLPSPPHCHVCQQLSRPWLSRPHWVCALCFSAFVAKGFLWSIRTWEQYKTIQVSPLQGQPPTVEKTDKCVCLPAFKWTILRSIPCGFQRSWHCFQQWPQYCRFIYCPFLPFQCHHFALLFPVINSQISHLHSSPWVRL